MAKKAICCRAQASSLAHGIMVFNPAGFEVSWSSLATAEYGREGKGHCGLKEKTMPYVILDGLKRYYEIHGEGETIVLLHHGFGCTRMWKEIYPALEAQGCRVVMYDRRGYGRSDKGEAFFEFYVSDAFREAGVEELEALRQALNLDGFHAVGQCEGGVVAVDYAAAHPERVKSLAASSTQCFSPVSMPVFNREKFPKSFQELDNELRAKLLEWHGEDHAGPFYEQFRDKGGSYGTGFFDLRPNLSKVRCPALVLYPDRSFLFEVEQGVHFTATCHRENWR